CGDDPSPEDEARDNGQALGEAIAGLSDVDLDGDDPEAAVESQIDEIDAAANTLADQVGGEISSQLDQLEEIVVGALNEAFTAVQAGNFGLAAEAIQEGFAQLDSLLTELSASDDNVVKAAFDGIEQGLDDAEE
ncbi:MAG: hypothetical protein AAGK32_04990, partial [Actinomycetota bacterium]